MTKQELEALRQEHVEAHKAFKEAVEEYKASRNPETATPEHVKPEEWKQEISDKYQKAKEAFAEISNKLVAADAEAREASEVEDAEERLSAWDAYHNKPSRLPGGYHKLEDADISRKDAERFASKLDYEAHQLQVQHGPKMTQAQRNHVKMLKGEARSYAKLGLNDEQREAYGEYFRKYVAYGSMDNRTHNARMAAAEKIPGEQFALLTSSDAGNLVPEDFQAEVVRDLVGMSVFRQLCRVVQTSRDTLVFPSVGSHGTQATIDQGYPSGFAGSWKSQRTASGGSVALTTQDQPTFGQERIQVHRWEPDAIEVPLEFVEDPAVDAEGVLAEIIAETKAMDEVSAFTSGDGVGQPEGIMSTGANVPTQAAGASATFTYSGLLDLWAALPAQYRQNANMMMNSASYATILAIEDTGNTLAFPPNSLPGTLWGRPVAFNEFMADVAAGASPVVYGDFRFYVIADRMELRVQRLVERMAPNTGLLAIARVGGQVVRRQAFRVGTTPT